MSESRLSLLDLERADDFVRRHIGPDEAQVRAMLEVVGAASLEDLIEKATPRAIRSVRPLDLPPARSETEALATLRAIAARNRVLTSMIGMGYYGTVTPAVILRNVMENPGWYTAYTPYQAEVSQGRLEALLAFQHMVADLTGLELANASLLDEATAAAEAMAMARRVSKSGASPFFVDADNTPVPGGWPEGGQTRLDIPNNHRQYAITWFLLAAGLIAVYVLYLRSQRRREPPLG